MADETTPQSSPAEPTSDSSPSTTEQGESQEPESSGASTLEEVEAYWRKRMSNSDKAHAAENKVLQEQLKAQSTSTEGAESASESPALKELQDRLQAAESRATAAELAAKYPKAVEAVGQAASSMDESALASLNERLDFDASAPKRINDTNNPSRSVSGEKSTEDMTDEELLAQLRSLPSPWG